MTVSKTHIPPGFSSGDFLPPVTATYSLGSSSLVWSGLAVGATGWANANHAHAASNSGGTVAASTATLASTVVVVDSTDTSSFIAMFDSATGSLAVKTDGDLTYNAGTGVLTATGFAGPITGAVTGNASTSTLASTVTVVDSTDTSSYVAMFDSATGSLAAKTDDGITYNAGTGTLTATAFAGPITGNVTGNASGTAATVTGGTQASITSAANLATVGTITSGVWQGTTVAVNQGGTGATTLNDLITLSTHTTGNYAATITGGTGITSTGATSGEGIAHSLSVDAAQTQITSVGALNAGSISSGFGNIDNGSSTLDTGVTTVSALNVLKASNATVTIQETSQEQWKFIAAGSGLYVTRDGSDQWAFHAGGYNKSYGDIDMSNNDLTNVGASGDGWTSNTITLDADAADIVVAPNTSAALDFIESGNGTVGRIDTRNSLANLATWEFFMVADATGIIDRNDIEQHLIRLAPFTTTLVDDYNVTVPWEGMMLELGVPTIAHSGSGTRTVTTASSFHIEPITVGSGIAVTNNRMISTGVADCYLTNLGAWTDASSTQKGKQDIIDLPLQDVGSLISQIRPRTYQYKDSRGDFGRTRYGAVAEEFPDFLRVPGDASNSAVNGAVLGNFALVASVYLADRYEQLNERLEAIGG